MKHYETPELKIVADYATVCTALQSSAEADGFDNDVKFNDIWNREG